MNFKQLCLGIGIGFIGGWATKEILSEKKYMSPEKVLENAKKTFNQSGTISGSWINMKPESFEKPPLSYQVYKGGVSRTVDGELEQFEFVSDAKTGTVIEAVKL